MSKLDKKSISETLRSIKHILESNYGVTKIGLVGSFSREEPKESSDLDFLVEFSKVNFNNVAGLSVYLEKIFDRKVDIIIKSSYLRKKFLDSIEKEVQYA